MNSWQARYHPRFPLRRGKPTPSTHATSEWARGGILAAAKHSRMDRHWLRIPATAEGQAYDPLHPRPPQSRTPDRRQGRVAVPGNGLGISLRWPGWPSRHIDHKPAAGLESHGKSARKNLHRMRLREWHTSLRQGPRPCATIWYANGPSHSPQSHALSNQSTLPENRQSSAPTSITRSKLAPRTSDKSDTT